MKACVLTFPAKSIGTGTQTVTGVVDKDGVPFVGKLFLFHGQSVLNTLVDGGVSFTDGFARGLGLDTGGGAWQTGQATATAGGIFGVLKVSSLLASGQHSVLGVQANPFLGGDMYRAAAVSAIRAGEFDLTYALNTRTGESYAVLVLGGDDLQVGLATLASLTVALGFPPEALLWQRQARLSGAAAATNTGGDTAGLGWSTRASGTGFSAARAVSSGGNGRLQRTDQAYGELSDTLGAAVPETVTAWGPTGVTVSGTVASSVTGVGLGGVHAAAGTLTQPALTGAQVVPVGLAPRVVLLSSVGAPANASVATDRAEWVLGLLDGTRQAAYWTAEDVVGDVTPMHGARYLSSADALLFGAPLGASTVFTARAQAGAFDPIAGTFALDWSAVDGVAREVLWLALGDALAPPAPPAAIPSDVTRAIYVPTAGIGGAEGGGFGTTRLRTLVVPTDRRVCRVPPEPRMCAVAAKEQQGRG